MDTKITMRNVKSAIKDDKAHIDYLKRDVLDDQKKGGKYKDCLLYTSPSPRDRTRSRMPSSA